VTLVQHFLENSADRLPGKVALVCDGQRLTYAQIEAASNRLAHALRDRGVGRGARVVLFLPNCVELVVGIFAAMKAGGVFVVVNYSTKYDKLAYVCENCGANALITSKPRSAWAERLSEQLPSLKVVVLTRLELDEVLSPGVLSYEGDPGCLPRRAPAEHQH
jgi:long-chain acyl-CoA synthetase